MDNVQQVRIEGEQYLTRDLSSKAILNNNVRELAKYNEQRRILEKNRALAEEVAILKQDMEEIKALLRALVLKE